MLVIRYRRVGKRNHAQYKIVVAEKAYSVKGKFVEALGSYDPHTKKAILKEDRINHWIGVGAQCSDSVHNLLVSKGLVKKAKRKFSFKGKVKEEVKEENLFTEGSKQAKVVVENSVAEGKEPEMIKEEVKEEAATVAEVPVKDEIKEEIQKEAEPEIEVDSNQKNEESPVEK